MRAHPGSGRLLSGAAVVAAVAVAALSVTACKKAPATPAQGGDHASAVAVADSPEHPAIEPAALQILQATSRKLTEAKSLTFTAVTTYEAFARTGQPLYYTTQSSVLVQHPDKLRVLTPGDGPASDFYYDGKVMTAYSPRENLVASADAPPTMEEMLKAADDKASITFPFSPLLAPDPYKNLTNGLTSAFVVGQSHVVGDTITDIVAFTNKNVQAEVWIGIDDGLPRMLRAVYRNDPNHLRYQMEFRDWRRNVDLAPAAFVFNNTSDAHEMQFARPDAPVQGAKK
jgi:hypothetical protein